MALLTAITIASEIASNEKARQGITNFAKSGANFFKELMRDEYDLPEVSTQDFQIIYEYTNYLFSLLGQFVLIDKNVCPEKIRSIDKILNEIYFSETGCLQEKVLKLLESSKEEFEQHVGYTIKNPLTIKKISKFAKNYDLEYEFYEYFSRVAFSSNNISEEENELIEAVASSLEINSFDKKNIEKKYKQ